MYRLLKEGSAKGKVELDGETYASARKAGEAGVIETVEPMLGFCSPT